MYRLYVEVHGGLYIEVHGGLHIEVHGGLYIEVHGGLYTIESTEATGQDNKSRTIRLTLRCITTLSHLLELRLLAIYMVQT